MKDELWYLLFYKRNGCEDKWEGTFLAYQLFVLYFKLNKGEESKNKVKVLLTERKDIKDISEKVTRIIYGFH